MTLVTGRVRAAARLTAVLGTVLVAVLGVGLSPASATPYRGPDGVYRQVIGAIEAHYRAIRGGAPFSPVGGPLTEELPTPFVYGRYQHFVNGSIYWSPATGAWEVHGAIRDTWARLGWENGPNGFPVSDERWTPGGRGKYNLFQDGAVYWTPTTGAHALQGLIWREYGAIGWETSTLGYPTTDELPTPNRFGRFNHFEGGSIYWSPATGAHAVGTVIRNVWAAAGWENSEFGFPVSDEYEVQDDLIAQDFEGGTLGYDPYTHEVVVLD
jgi:uncharacterized protein with LGFP repeats